MTSHTQHLEIFDEKYKSVYARYPEFQESHAILLNDIKQHLIQTVISVLESEISKIESHIQDIDGYQINISYESERDAYIKCRDSLTTTLSTWKALL